MVNPDLFFNHWKNTARVIVIGNGPSLAKINLNAFKDEVTVGVNGILYNGFEPTFVCITDHVIVDTHPPDIIFGSKTSRYLLRQDLYQRYQDVIHRFLTPQQIYLCKFNQLDFMDPSVITFDSKLQSFNVSYSVMIDLVFPLAYFLKTFNVYMMGIDHNNFKKHSYDSFLTSEPIEPPNPQKIVGFNDHVQADDLSRRYAKAKKIMEKNGIQVWNMGVDSHLEVFNKIDIRSLFPLGLKDSTLTKTNNNQIFFWTNHRINYPFRFVSNPQGRGYFESVLNPQFRLRHKYGKIVIEPSKQNDSQFMTDSTFQIEHGMESHNDRHYHQVSFRCINKTSFYLQREDSVTLIRPYGNLKRDSVNTLGCNLSESGDHWVIEFKRLGRFYVASERNTDRQKYVRFVSIEQPNYNLRHYGGKIMNHHYLDQKQFLHDSTFILETSPGKPFILSQYQKIPQTSLEVYISSKNKKDLYMGKNSRNEWIITTDAKPFTLYPLFSEK